MFDTAHFEILHLLPVNLSNSLSDIIVLSGDFGAA